MKKILAAVIAVILMLTAMPVYADNVQEQTAPISPALDIISGRLRLAKTTVSGSAIQFSSDDFDGCIGKKVESVTVISLPMPSDGTLALSSVALSAGQIIKRRDFDKLCFIPAGNAETEASFTFVADGSSRSYEIECMLYVLDQPNYAPASVLVNENCLSLTTYSGVSCCGVMKAVDPESDRLYYEIVSAPKKGSIKVTDRSYGSFVYMPLDSFSGSDSFKYVAYDSYGNRSDVMTMRVSVLKNKSNVEYSDMDGHWAYSAAIAMTDAGIMSGYNGDSDVFSPDTRVSRSEFLAMAMKAAGYKVLGSAVLTSFADDSSIPDEYRGYVAAGLELEFVSGTETEYGMCFRPNDPITRGEAAVMLNNILSLPVPAVRAVFADSEALPSWASDALYALNETGIITGMGEGYISPASYLTRAQTAQILSRVAEL